MAEATTATHAQIATRNLVGLAVVALANPLIYFGGGGYQWSVTLGAALLGACVVYGLYALVFTKRAKAAWPGQFFVLAWVLMALNLFNLWTDQTPRAQPAQTTSSAPAKGQTFTYEQAVGRSEIEEAMKNAPAYQPPR